MAMEETFAPKPAGNEPWEVAIIGSGPAALTAAIYTTRGAASTIVLGGAKWGGQLMLTTDVDNYPGFEEGIQGPELMLRMRKQAERFGAEFVQDDVKGVDFDKRPFEILAGDKKYLAKTVIISTGADTKWLGVPGEKELIGRGVSSCAPCDAPFFKGKSVAVVGGGDSAMEEALVLTKYATSVMMIHRRGEFRASQAMQSKVLEYEKEGKIKIIWDTEVTEVQGGERLESVIVRTKTDSKMAEILKKGKLAELGGELIEEKEGFVFWKLPLDGVFVAIGHVPATAIFSGKIELDEKGYVVTKNQPSTNIGDGIFVAGDVHDYRYRQAITAAGFGCMAGMEALRYLDKPPPSW